jgi:hypothetical protein
MVPQWIAALSALFVAGFGAWKTSAELARWRTERRDVKRAETAGEVLAATLRFLSQLKGNTSQAIRSVDEPGDTGLASHERFRLMIDSRWEQFQSTADRFSDAWEKAETYLPSEVNAVLESISDEQRSIWSAQVTCIGLPPVHAAPFFKDGFGSVPQARIAELREEAKRILRPIAQLERARARSGEAKAS